MAQIGEHNSPDASRMLPSVSDPPRRDLPIEWRTNSGEVIAGPPAIGAKTAATHSAAAVPSHAAEPSVPLSAEDHFELEVDERERRIAICLRIVVVALVGIAVGVTSVTGGLATAPSTGKELPVAAVGEPVDTGPYRVTVERAAIFTKFGATEPDAPGGSLLAVMATVEVTAERSRSLTNIGGRAVVDAGGLSGVTEAAPHRILYLRDGASVGSLQPGLPERVVFIWEIKPDAVVPAEIEVELRGATYRRTNFVFLNEWTWWDEGPRAR